jgi:hypothetical protein
MWYVYDADKNMWLAEILPGGKARFSGVWMEAMEFPTERSAKARAHVNANCVVFHWVQS